MEGTGQRIYLPRHVMLINWAEEGLDIAQGVFTMNRAGFSSEAKGPMLCSYTSHFVLPAIPTTRTPLSENKINKQNQKQKQSPIWKSEAMLVKIHTFVSSAYTVLEESNKSWPVVNQRADSGSQLRIYPASVIQRKSCPATLSPPGSQKKLPQHRSPGPILRHR